jgi:hypothetical protein
MFLLRRALLARSRATGRPHSGRSPDDDASSFLYIHATSNADGIELVHDMCMYLLEYDRTWEVELYDVVHVPLHITQIGSWLATTISHRGLSCAVGRGW